MTNGKNRIILGVLISGTDFKQNKSVALRFTLFATLLFFNAIIFYPITVNKTPFDKSSLVNINSSFTISTFAFFGSDDSI